MENNYYEHVKNPWELLTNIGITDGKLHASSNNISFMDTSYGMQWLSGWYSAPGQTQLLIPGNDSVFTPPYSYTLDNAQDVKNIVMTNAGNKKSGSDGVDESTLKIAGFALCQNYPNPFNHLGLNSPPLAANK